jgi:hypothetical protein
MAQERESGQSIVVIAGVAIVLLALVALVVDVGNAYAHRRLVQNAVDAAALAGARRLAERGIGQPVLEIQVLNDVEEFAGLNGVESDAVQAWFIDADGARLETVDPWLGPAPGDAEGVEVEGDLPFNTYIAGFLGFPSMIASTNAKAWVLSGPCSAESLFPLTVSTGTFTETTGIPTKGKVYTLWDQNKPSSPGNWGWLYWEDENGVCHCPDPDVCCPQNAAARNLEENILDNSRSGIWQVGDWVHGGSGVMIGGVLDRLFPYAYPDGPDVIIPLYDDVRGSGNNTEYLIGGFAAFRLRCVYASKGHYQERIGGDCAVCAESGRSSDKCIRGEFVDMVVPSGQDGCDDTGIYIPSFRKPRD